MSRGVLWQLSLGKYLKTIQSTPLRTEGTGASNRFPEFLSTPSFAEPSLRIKKHRIRLSGLFVYSENVGPFLTNVFTRMRQAMCHKSLLIIDYTVAFQSYSKFYFYIFIVLVSLLWFSIFFYDFLSIQFLFIFISVLVILVLQVMLKENYKFCLCKYLK